MFQATVLGPNLILDGLLVYYDITNPNCFNGTGDTVYNLVSTKSNGTISNPFGYIYDNTYPQSIAFFSSAQITYKVDFPESYTIISIAKSIGGNSLGWIGSSQTSGIVPMVNVYANGNYISLAGETVYIPIFIPPNPVPIDTYANYAEIIDNSVPISSSARMNYFANIIPPYEYNSYNMAFYAGSWSSNSQLLKMYSVNPINPPYPNTGNIQPIVSTPTSITRTSDPNAIVYVGNGGMGTQIAIGAHLLYNRQLSDQEIQMTYQIFKSKFNLIY